MHKYAHKTTNVKHNFRRDTPYKTFIMQTVWYCELLQCVITCTSIIAISYLRSKGERSRSCGLVKVRHKRCRNWRMGDHTVFKPDRNVRPIYSQSITWDLKQ